MFQDPGHAFLKNLQRKLLFKFLPADLAHVAAQDRIIQEKLNLVSKHSNIMLRNEEARLTIINNSWYSSFCRRDARQTMFHSLQQYKRETLVMMERRKKREDRWVFENFAFQKLFQSIFPFLYHSTMTLAFSSQESSICLSLQFSERSFSKDRSFSSSLRSLAKS